MSRSVELARSALDSLPMAVAVVGPGGDLLLANDAFDDAGGDGRYVVGAGVAEADAAAVADGVAAVLAGERERFTREYAADAGWYLLQAGAFDWDGERRAAVAAVDVTDRVEAEVTADERAAQLDHVLDRLDGLVGDLTAEVVHARSRSEAERVACERFVDAEPYRFAWVGRPDLRGEQLSPREWAGVTPPTFGDQQLPLAHDEDPTVRAYETGRTQMAPDLTDVASAWDPAELWDAVAMAAVPLTYRSKTYGVLTVYADRADLFDERERSVLTALGRAVGTAIHAQTTGRVLTTASLVEVECTVTDPDSYLTALTVGTDATVTCEDSMVEDDGDLLLYLTVEGRDPEAVTDLAADHGDIVDARVLTESAEGLLVAVTATGSLVAEVADHEGLVTELVAEGGRLSATVAFPDETAARAAFEHLQSRYGDVELTGYRERERESDTAGGFVAAVEDDLTERQLTALRTAYLSGYFEWPRPVSGDEVAESMDITRATFHQHLREAQRKLAAAFFGSKLD
jgi:predicted DNA binding protein